MIELPRRSRPDIHADINIVPYIDVMLVLASYIYDDYSHNTARYGG